ncbi:hypothetical protein [Vibrio mediterranei]|uniref:hypothetical protein n=1 Tax=Vibrio mediterranei TaxID=689 RepID=UPI00406806F8
MIDTLSDIALSQELKRLIRQAKQLKSSIPADPANPEQFVEKARIETELTEISNRQTTIGELLLERDKTAEKRKVKQLEAKLTNGTDKANELVDRLPAFAEKVSIAFMALGAEYAELLDLSTEVRSVNTALLNASQPQCIQAALLIEPNNLHKLLKEQFRESFGANTADVFLPQKTKGFDIVEAVAAIQQAVTAKKVQSDE